MYVFHCALIFKIQVLASVNLEIEGYSLRVIACVKVMDAKGEKLLAIFPAKFQKSMWIKRGNFVVIDESGRDEAIDSGRKVAGVVTQVLYHEQVRVLQKSAEWPEIFRSLPHENENSKQVSSSCDNDKCSSDEDGLPPLEANMNRINPLISRSDVDTESDSDTDTDL